MVRLEFLLTTLVLLGTLAPPAQAAGAAPAQCSVDLTFAGLCAPPQSSAEIRDGGVDLSAGVNSGGGVSGENGSGLNDGPGRAADAGSDGDGSGDGSSDASSGGAAGEDSDSGSWAPIVVVRDSFVSSCRPGPPCDPELLVRTSDLASFRPVVPGMGMEPNGWAVTGLPANFFARAAMHVQSGQLLGFPAEVRFTPTGYRWDFGDGTRIETGSGGARWDEQGLPEFSETGTSHVFAETGSFTVALTVLFAAEYRFFAPTWLPVVGTLAVPVASQPVRAYTASTVLVDADCNANPRGPGC